MGLPTYPRLNLPTKRFGIESSDWLWVGSSILPGLLLRSIIWFIVCFGASYFYAARIKPKKCRGWLSAKVRFLYRQLRHRTKTEASLESETELIGEYR